jgi:hypothetical protein
LEVVPLWPICMLMKYYGGFSPTFSVKGALDQHIRLIESIPHSWTNPFTRREHIVVTIQDWQTRQRIYLWKDRGSFCKIATGHASARVRAEPGGF